MAEPWQTLKKVNDIPLMPGDMVLFKRGDTFYGSLIVKRSGSQGNEIGFGAYGDGDNPIITGFHAIPSWVDLGNNIWESADAASSLTYCNMLTIEGINTPMGRYPKISSPNKGYLTYQSHQGHTSITSRDLTGTPDWTGAEVVIRNQSFHLKRAFVISQSGATLHFSDIGEGFTDGNGFFFQNDIRCCTRQNEWYYQNTSGKIKIYSTSQPAKVNIANVENLITIRASFLKFKDLKLTGANGCAFFSPMNAKFRNVTIGNCIFNQIGVAAVNVNVDFLTVSNNRISDCNITSIETNYGNNVTITGNNIRSIGLSPGMRNNKVYTSCNSNIDWAFCSNYTVTNNEIHNVGFNGISFWTSSNVLIENNFVDTFCTVLDDGGAIYSYSIPEKRCSNVQIRGNILINGIGAIEGATFEHNAAGIYLDANTINTEVSYNTVANTSVTGICWTSAGNNYAHHNTVFNASKYQFRTSNYQGLKPPTGDRITNNIFVCKHKTEHHYFDYDAPQKALFFNFYLGATDPTPYILNEGVIDSNYYARPVDDTKTIFATLPEYGKCHMTLSEWQTFSKQDAHSHKSFMKVKSPDDILFYYNASFVEKRISLDQPVVDVKGVKYQKSITLAPFTSIVLLRNPAGGK
jgi:Endopolygalacturonase